MKKGFTLIELLVVVLIIGILSAIALPQYQTAVDKARYTTMMAAVRALRNAQDLYNLANGSYTTDIHDLESVLPAECEIVSNEKAVCSKFEIQLQGNSDPYGRLLSVPQSSFLASGDGSFLCFAYKEDQSRGRKLCTSLGGKMLSTSIDASCSRDCTIYQL